MMPHTKEPEMMNICGCCKKPIYLDKSIAKLNSLGYWQNCPCHSTTLFKVPRTTYDLVDMVSFTGKKRSK